MQDYWIGIFLSGCNIFLLAAGFLLIKPDVTKIIPEEVIKLYTAEQIAELWDKSSYLLYYGVKFLLFEGVLSILLGVYLMKSNNLFLRLCYPNKNKEINIESTNEIRLETDIKEPREVRGEPSENKYAHPGYFE